MASVFLARSDGPAGFEKLVALKRIHPHLAKENEFVEMFLDEARIAARISHPNVCTVFDFGEADGSYFIAMEYLVGESVSRIMKTICAAPDRQDWPSHACLAARLVADACEGLHAAHELRGDDGAPLELVHRDVSPQNLFVGYDGTVKVVDFGIARAAGRLHHTATGTVKGKWAYMAPEQARRTALDRRADVWSLGVVLWELVTCRRLFRREGEAETLTALLNDPIPAPSDVRPGVPRELDEIVSRALTRDREERYPTARAFGSALSRFIAAQGQTVGLAEISEWMREIFPEDYGRRLELVDQARRSQTGRVPRISASLDTGSLSPSGLDRAPPVVISPEHSAVRTAHRSARWPIGAGAVAVAALAVGAYWLLGGGVPSTPPSPIDAPHAAVAAPTSPTASEVPAPPPPTPPVPVAGIPAQPPTGPASPPAAAPPAPPAPAAPEARPAAPTKAPAVPPRTAPPSPTGSGTLGVFTPGGWADVFVDGTRRGRTPTQLTLPAGRHVVELRPFGELPARRRVVQIRTGQTLRLPVPL